MAVAPFCKRVVSVGNGDPLAARGENAHRAQPVAAGRVRLSRELFAMDEEK